MLDGWKTIIGAVLTLAIAIGSMFGIDPTPVDDLPEWAALIFMTATTIFTIWSRFKAKGPAAPQVQRALGRIE